MSRLTLRLPETLHQQLANLAKKEGISLNQYIIYSLTRQVSSAYIVETISKEDVKKQQDNFNNLITELKQTNSEEVTKALSKREIVQPEAELTPAVVDRLKAKIKATGSQ